MTDFLKQDIFFFVTTIAVVMFLILGSIAMVYIIQIVKHINYIAKRARHQTDLLTEDLDSIRDRVRTEGFRIKHLWEFFTNINKKGKK